MFDPSQALSGLRVPESILIALDNRTLHFALQPTHFLVRAVHVATTAAFFGGIVVLDLRLMGLRVSVALRPLADLILPWLGLLFAISFVTGVALFLYDPLHVGSHAYFTLKLAFIVLGLANAALFHRTNYDAARAGDPKGSFGARIAGGLSLAFWLAVMLAASLNVEGAPKVLLQASLIRISPS
jgi:hypothetical protein